jgi:hypothetical protein
MGWSFLREPAKHETELSRQGGISNPHYSCALLLQSPIPDSSETGKTGGKSATGRARAHTSRKSRFSRLSRATPPFRNEPS